MNAEDFQRLSEYEFYRLVETALPNLLELTSVATEASLGRNRHRADFVVQLDSGRPAIVEVKGLLPSTRSRLASVVAQLRSLSDAYRDHVGMRVPQLALVTAGSLSPDNVQYLHDHGVDYVFDGNDISRALTAISGKQTGGYRRPEDLEVPLFRTLIDELASIAPGKKQWAEYQAIVQDILEHLLCPPLSKPISESANSSRVNRRDIIFPNYATVGPWMHVRNTYEGHFVVVDAKNYSGPIKKRAVIDIANYLTKHGTGLFGMLVTRNSSDRGADITRREQWFMHQKMVIVVNDDDLRQMWTMAETGDDPSQHIIQKIEDFRIAF